VAFPIEKRKKIMRRKIIFILERRSLSSGCYFILHTINKKSPLLPKSREERATKKKIPVQ